MTLNLLPIKIYAEITLYPGSNFVVRKWGALNNPLGNLRN